MNIETISYQMSTSSPNLAQTIAPTVSSNSSGISSTDLLLRKLEQLKEIRNQGLLHSFQQANSSSVNQEPFNNLANFAQKGEQDSGAQYNSLQTSTRSPSLPVTTWVNGEEVFLFGCVPKYVLNSLNSQLQFSASESINEKSCGKNGLLEAEFSTGKRPRCEESSDCLSVSDSEEKEAETAQNGKRLTGESSKQKRTKWKAEDLSTLWRSISLHGNEWQKVRKSLQGRTYHQVKDKGKRLLHEHGWETGRSKVQNDVACERAKEIATKVLHAQNLSFNSSHHLNFNRSSSA